MPKPTLYTPEKLHKAEAGARDEAKDLNIKIGVRNGRLLRAIRKAHPSVAAFARASGQNVTAINALICLRSSPVTRKGEWREVSRNIAAALAMYPDELWPEHIRNLRAKKSTAEIEMNTEELPQLQSGSMTEARRLLAKWSDDLPERHGVALSMHFEGATLEEIGSHLSVGRERARQIVRRAYRTMQQGALRDGVRSVNDIDGVTT